MHVGAYAPRPACAPNPRLTYLQASLGPPPTSPRPACLQIHPRGVQLQLLPASAPEGAPPLVSVGLSGAGHRRRMLTIALDIMLLLLLRSRRVCRWHSLLSNPCSPRCLWCCAGGHPGHVQPGILPAQVAPRLVETQARAGWVGARQGGMGASPVLVRHAAAARAAAVLQGMRPRAVEAHAFASPSASSPSHHPLTGRSQELYTVASSTGASSSGQRAEAAVAGADAHSVRACAQRARLRCASAVAAPAVLHVRWQHRCASG